MTQITLSYIPSLKPTATSHLPFVLIAYLYQLVSHSHIISPLPILSGLLVGAATVIGGIGGTVLGAKVSEYFLKRVKSAFFLVPALFTIPATGHKLEDNIP